MVIEWVGDGGEEWNEWSEWVNSNETVGYDRPVKVFSSSYFFFSSSSSSLLFSLSSPVFLVLYSVPKVL